VFNILLGRDAGWQPQRRDDGSIPFRDIVRRHRWQVLLGIVTGVSAFLIATSLFAWMSPTILGLVLAIPLSWLSGQLALGLALKRWGLLLTPEESTPPPIVLRSNELQKTFGADNIDETDGLTALATDPLLMERHVAMLPPQSPRGRGQIDPDHVVAQAKLVDAESVTEAASWLKPRERMIVQHDRALLALLARLPPTPSPRVEAAAE
jgi:membrane glycosyltransferase